MNAGFYIARRYFLSRKKQNFINIIAIISILVVTVGTMALVVALSVFNGLEELLKSLHSNRDPEIKMTLKKGKSFPAEESFLDSIRQTKGVSAVTEVIEDNALLKYKNKQVIVKFKGVSSNFDKQYNLEPMITEGDLKLKEGNVHYAVLGRGIRNRLSVSLNNRFRAIEVWYPKRGKTQVLNPRNAFNTSKIMAGGVFAVERQFDENYIFVPLEFAEDLVNYKNRRTAIEIKTSADYSMDEVKGHIQSWLSPAFKLEDIQEQHASLLRAIKIEKLFVYFTFTFILGIASLNIFFSLSMLVLEKRRDVSVLKTMGASKRMIQRVFMLDGAYVAFTGAAVGLIAGVVICYLQHTYGFVSMGMQTSVVEAYPVKMEALDFVITGITIVIITLLAAVQPAKSAGKIPPRFQ